MSSSSSSSLWVLNIKSYLFANFTFECTVDDDDVSAPRRQARSQKLFTATTKQPPLYLSHSLFVCVCIISLPKLDVCFQWCHMVALSRKSQVLVAKHTKAKTTTATNTLRTRTFKMAASQCSTLLFGLWRHGSLKPRSAATEQRRFYGNFTVVLLVACCATQLLRMPWSEVTLSEGYINYNE